MKLLNQVLSLIQNMVHFDRTARPKLLLALVHNWVEFPAYVASISGFMFFR